MGEEGYVPDELRRVYIILVSLVTSTQNGPGNLQPTLFTGLHYNLESHSGSQFQITVPKLNKPPLTTRLANGANDTKKKGWLPEEGIATWLTNKATDTWAEFGKEKSGWKVRSISMDWLLGLEPDDSLAESIPGWRADDGPYGIRRIGS